MAQTRIIDQETDLQLETGDYVLVDSLDEGTRKFDLGSHIASTGESVSELSNKIGDSTMGTTATTITGAIAEHEEDISSLSSSLSSLIVTADKVSQDVTLASGARLSVQIDCALDGYTLLGVIGITTISTEVFAINRFFLTATNTVTVTIYNTYSDSRTSKITVRCIYRKS